MYNIASSYSTHAFADSRRNYIKAVFSSATLQGDNIISVEFTENVHDGSNIGLGLTPSQMVKMTFKQPSTPITLAGAWFTLYHSFDNTVWCPLGKFKISEYENKTSTVEIKAFDAMAYMAETYTSSITYPATLSAIVTDIATQFNFQVETTTYPSGTFALPTGATVRQMLGYVAGYLGKNALFNRDGKLEFRWFTSQATPQTLTSTNYVRNGMEKTAQNSYVIEYLVSGTSDNPITSGSGNRGITFTNPWMTQARLDTIKAATISTGFTFLACKIEYHGNPAWEVGDIIQVTEGSTTYNVPINQQTLNISGNLKATMECKSDSEQQTLITPQTASIEDLQREVQNLERMSQTITGATGGYYRLLQDPNDANRPYGFQIGEDQNFTKKWMFTYGGLGFYNGSTLLHNSVAFDMNGNLNADYITAGSISANRISAGTISGAVTATNFTMNGGSINVNSSSSSTNVITLNYGSGDAIVTAKLAPNGLYCDFGTLGFYLNAGGIGYRQGSSSYTVATGTNLYEGGTAISSKYAPLSHSHSEYYGYGSSIYAAACNPTSSGSGNVGTSSNYWNLVHSNNFCVHTSTTNSNVAAYISTSGYIQKFGSSERFKNNIRPLEPEWKEKCEALYEVPVKNWNYKEECSDFTGDNIGIIAEELEEKFPELCAYDQEGRVEAYSEIKLVNAMLVLIQEQHNEIESLKARIEALEKK